MKKMDMNSTDAKALQGLAKDLMMLMIYTWDGDADKSEDDFWDEALAAADKIAVRYQDNADVFEAARGLLVSYLKTLEKHQRQPQMITATGAGFKREGSAA